MDSTERARPGHRGFPRLSTEERLAHEAPLAVTTVLFRAHDRARATVRQLELEEADPRVAAVLGAARDLQRTIAELLIEITVAHVDEIDVGKGVSP